MKKILCAVLLLSLLLTMPLGSKATSRRRACR